MSLPRKRKKLEPSQEDKTSLPPEPQKRQTVQEKGKNKKKSTTAHSEAAPLKSSTVTTAAEVNEAFELVENLDQSHPPASTKNAVFERDINQSLEASNIIQNHVILATGAGLIPAPFLDMFLATGIQVRMVNHLARLYRIDFSATRAKYLIVALGGNYAVGVSSLWGGASMAKIIPGIGLILGTAVLPVVMGVFTYATGKAISRHFELGGMLSDFDPEAYKEYFDEQIKEGQRRVADLQRNKGKQN